MSSTEQLLDRHLDCFGRGDLDGIVADYSSAAVMFTPRGPLKGPVPFVHSFRQSLRSLENLERRFPYSYGALTAITPTFSGVPRQQTILTKR